MDRHASEIVEVTGQQLLAKLFHRLDGGDYGGVAALFHADGSWMRRGKQLVGAAEIAAALTDRSPTLVSFHVITNIAVDRVDEDRAAILAYLTVYRYDGGSARQGPAPLTGPAAIAICRGELTRRDGDWKLSHFVVEAPALSADVKA
jgi:hypothetical protein